MKKLIYLADLSHKTGLGLSSDTMPYQIGLIGAYCLKEHGDKIDVRLFKFVDDLDNAIQKETPFIIGCSNYFWNTDLSDKVISAVKKKYPEIITVFGGPNYPGDVEEQIGWLKKHPSLDFFIYKDGEIPFANLVGYLLQTSDIEAAKRAKLNSCHALIDDKPFFGETKMRPTDLDIIPSPYTTGLMDQFFDTFLIPTIQTNRGCPFPCIFCNAGGKYYTKVAKSSFERKKADIEYIVKHIRHTQTLCITDSNFGMYSEDEVFCKYLSEVQKQTGFPEFLVCSAGKNKKERIVRCNELLRGALRLSVAVQSLNPDVLRNVRRKNISLSSIMFVSDHVGDTDTYSFSEIILGLPGDTLMAEKETMSGLISAGINNITQYQLYLLNGTEIASPSLREKYRFKTMFRPVQRSIGSYTVFGECFSSVEIQEICVSTDTLSYEDYLEARRLYLTVSLFYNDRIFDEINALLRLLKLPAWDWLIRIHEGIAEAPPEIRQIYSGFTADTESELWETPEELRRDVLPKIDRYISGELGGNVIFKYRSQAVIEHFPLLHQTAYRYLRKYLREKNTDCGDAVSNIERYSFCQKSDILNTNTEEIHSFDYDVIRMIREPSLARGSSLDDLRYPVRIHFYHRPEQKESMNRQLRFYGSDIGSIRHLMARFPIKRFYRSAEYA